MHVEFFSISNNNNHNNKNNNKKHNNIKNKCLHKKCHLNIMRAFKKFHGGGGGGKRVC